MLAYTSMNKKILYKKINRNYRIKFFFKVLFSSESNLKYFNYEN